MPRQGEDRGPEFGEFKVPFVFATNGRPYLKQLETKSGIWFRDVRKPTNLSRALSGWYTPEGLKQVLGQDFERSHEQLSQEPTEYLQLRDYQLDAIHAVEAGLEEGKREMLLAMATGTGKTRTCIGLCYRLIKTKRVRRILFLVDRTALGKQALNAFKESQLEGLRTFSEIFDIKELKDVEPEVDTKIHVATVQSLVKRVLFCDDEEGPPPVDRYDCIVVDECHRGYLLDKELSDLEFSFRDEADYVSKYRRVLEHFDAVKVGLTATPAVHTVEIFGQPVFQYSYREAVIDGYLVDHEPPMRIETKLGKDGITWEAGTQLEMFDPGTGEIDSSTLEDEVSVEIEQFNRRVVTENFNRAVCGELAKRIDPELDEKTLIFCVTDDHADLVVKVLKEELEKQYGEVDDRAVVKITGTADRPLELIRRYRNEREPNIVVTVDLMTTGIDVPKICNLVFLRRVKSRILYHQMLGRATRLCDEIKKEAFRIYDAVDIYSALAPFSDMKPVVPNPKVPFEQLVGELVDADREEVQKAIVEQFIAKLQRKARLLTAAQEEDFAAVAGGATADVLEELLTADTKTAARWITDHSGAAAFLDRVRKPAERVLISHHEDKLLRVEDGFGAAASPGDYLDGFKEFVTSNLNALPAMIVVTQRPRELTRAQLKQLVMALDAAGYSEINLRTAWRQAKNEDIAATIIGFIRQAALGDPLVPYSKRVERAMEQVLGRGEWTPPQRQWLERIGKQLVKNVVVDQQALNEGQFQARGGFSRINKVFGGRLDHILGDISEAIWAPPANAG